MGYRNYSLSPGMLWSTCCTNTNFIFSHSFLLSCNVSSPIKHLDQNRTQETWKAFQICSHHTWWQVLGFLSQSIFWKGLIIINVDLLSSKTVLHEDLQASLWNAIIRKGRGSVSQPCGKVDFWFQYWLASRHSCLMAFTLSNPLHA